MSSTVGPSHSPPDIPWLWKAKHQLSISGALLATSAAVSRVCLSYGSPSVMVRLGTECAVKITGNFDPCSTQALAHPVRSFSANASINRGWSCHSSTKSIGNEASCPSSTSLYKPTLVRELCGARQIATACPTLSDAICCSASARNGCQFRIPTYAGSPNSCPTASACRRVILVSGELPISEYRCWTS